MLKKKAAICAGGWLCGFIVYLLLLALSSKVTDSVLFFRACLISVVAGICPAVIWVKNFGGGI